jgi:predicted amidophosphoribosyltransferase
MGLTPPDYTSCEDCCGRGRKDDGSPCPRCWPQPASRLRCTLKIDGDMYMRLDMLRAKERRTHQDILKQALEEFLDRVEA